MRRVGWGGPGRPDVFDRPGGSPFGRPPCRLPPRRPPGPLAISAKLRGAPPLVCMSICMQKTKSPPHGALAEERTRTYPWCRRRRPVEPCQAPLWPLPLQAARALFPVHFQAVEALRRL